MKLNLFRFSKTVATDRNGQRRPSRNELAAADCGRTAAEAAFREIRRDDSDSIVRSMDAAFRRLHNQILNSRLERV